MSFSDLWKKAFKMCPIIMDHPVLDTAEVQIAERFGQPDIYSIQRVEEVLFSESVDDIIENYSEPEQDDLKSQLGMVKKYSMSSALQKPW